MFSLICASTIGWANNRDAWDLRRHRANYDAAAMRLYPIHYADGMLMLCFVSDANHMFRSGCDHGQQGVVSRTFRELSKIFSRNLCVVEIALPMSISSWNFVRVPKAKLWTHVHSFSLKLSPQIWLLALYIFARLFWRARETLVKQPPGHGTEHPIKYAHGSCFV